MAFLSDSPAAPTAPADPLHTALTDAVNSVGEKLSAALAQASRSQETESRRRIEHVLGRRLVPLFALELVTLLFAQGSEARELRAAFVRLLSMTESPDWALALTQGPAAIAGPDDEARFLASAGAACVQDFARCGECLAGCASEPGRELLTSDEAASLQWARCAQCKCGTAAWHRR